MESLIYDLAKAFLVDQCGYPPDIAKRSYDRDFAVRGLAVDTEKGLLLKLSYIHTIGTSTGWSTRPPLPPPYYRDGAHAAGSSLIAAAGHAGGACYPSISQARGVPWPPSAQDGGGAAALQRHM